MKNRRIAVISAAALFSAAGLAQAQIAENFDNLSAFDPNNPQGETLPGWAFQNNANPPGGTGMYNGGPTLVFPPQASTGFLAANYNNCTGISTISTFAITPQVLLQNGQAISFWARTVDVPTYPDRLQVRMSQAGASTNVGALGDPTAVGDFTTLLLDINPTYTTTGFPNVWQQYILTLSGLPAGGVQGRFAFRYFVEAGGPSGANSDFIGIDEVAYGAPPATGACCMPNGSCNTSTQITCTATGGTYAGDNVTCAAANCPQPPSGACCAANGTCTFVNSFACTASGGTWAGAGVTCAAANCQPTGWTEVGDAGDTLATAQAVTASTAASVQFISGNIEDGNADVYKIRICNEASFSATTAGTTPATTIDTQLFLFNSAGVGVVMDDDDTSVTGTLQSRITTQFVTANGDYYLGISSYDNDAVDGSAQAIWNDQNATPAYGPEWTPNGPGAANPWSTFDHAASGAGAYRIETSGVCFLTTTVACYANCDGSTNSPLLTANDFQCFLNEYAANHSYANCDGSTNAPVLTANDFQCFLNAYAVGCS